MNPKFKHWTLENMCPVWHEDKWGMFDEHPQPVIACSKLTIERLEQGVKYVQC